MEGGAGLPGNNGKVGQQKTNLKYRLKFYVCIQSSLIYVTRDHNTSSEDALASK